MKIWVHGAQGKMGQEVIREIKSRPGFQHSGSSSRGTSLEECLLADALIDFSSAEGTASLCQFLLGKSLGRLKTILIGSTGLTDKTVGLLKGLKGVEVIFSANTSRGIFAMQKAIEQIGAILSDFDVSIEETHHSEKKDAPSGTALLLKKSLPHKTKIFSQRLGGIFGEHTVRFVGQHEELVVTHRAFSRALFAKGAVDIVIAEQRS